MNGKRHGKGKEYYKGGLFLEGENIGEIIKKGKEYEEKNKI